MKVILTGATGMVGEGVLFECIENPKVSNILIVGRSHYNIKHPKVKELLVLDFFNVNECKDKFKEYDACFYCVGRSSVGLNEKKYTAITYDTTMVFANTLLEQNPDITFVYVSEKGSDISGRKKTMWARVKGKTENHLLNLGFKAIYNLRPYKMLPTKKQKNIDSSTKMFSNLYKMFSPKSTITLKQLGEAMINVSLKPYSKQILEIFDIKKVASDQY